MTIPKSKKPRTRKPRAAVGVKISLLCGKYKGKGLLKALAEEKKREREL